MYVAATVFNGQPTAQNSTSNSTNLISAEIMNVQMANINVFPSPNPQITTQLVHSGDFENFLNDLLASLIPVINEKLREMGGFPNPIIGKFDI